MELAKLKYGENTGTRYLSNCLLFNVDDLTGCSLWLVTGNGGSASSEGDSQYGIIPNPNPIYSMERKFGCEMCGKRFRDKCGLRNHMNIHLGLRPHVCDICKKSFSQSSAMLRHRKGHFKFALEVCEMSCMKKMKCALISPEYRYGLMIGTLGDSTAQEGLVGPNPIYSMERKFGCEVCGRRFRHSNGLNNHMNIHLGLRPYICDICQKTFSQSSAMKRHRKGHFKSVPFQSP
ncbi:uncharacterized protein LOC141908388 [Tubulanus polymorphus]|uniref:uncharacterized protein LOC141908388 n=1 Tax=Tubulanus polymorphus TaxID=672921 RepID=UPI003DA223ED